MTIQQLNPPLWFTTPEGPALCHFMIDYGIDCDIVWVCFQQDTGECWSWNNKDVRIAPNLTVNRSNVPSPADRLRDALNSPNPEPRKIPMSVEHTDKEAAANAVAPRVSLADIEARIKEEHTFFASDAVSVLKNVECDPSLALLAICLIVVDNGFTVIGKSAPAAPENFNPTLGAKFAREDAIRQLWPLMGFELRTKLMQQPEAESKVVERVLPAIIKAFAETDGDFNAVARAAVSAIRNG